MALSARALVTTLLVVGTLVLLGCEDDGDRSTPVPQPPSTQFIGVFAGGADGGRADITINSTNLAPAKPGGGRVLGPVAGSGPFVTTTVSAFATLSPTGGAAAFLTGTYDSEADTLSLSGGGYAIRGQQWGSIIGSVSGPNGDSQLQCVEDGSGDIWTYCCAFQSDSTDRAGRVNLLLYTSEGINGIGGVVCESGDDVAGTLSGMSGSPGDTIVTTLFLGYYFTDLAHSGFIFQGKLTAATGVIAGTWTYVAPGGSYTDNGTWSGTQCLVGTAQSRTFPRGAERGPVLGRNAAIVKVRP